MCLPGLEPRHDQICSWSLTTQPSLQIDAQKKKKKLEVNLKQFLKFFFIYFNNNSLTQFYSN